MLLKQMILIQARITRVGNSYIFVLIYFSFHYQSCNFNHCFKNFHCRYSDYPRKEKATIVCLCVRMYIIGGQTKMILEVYNVKNCHT